MKICFHAVAFLVPLIGGVEHGAGTAATSYSSITTWPQRHFEDNLLQAVDEVDAGPDPFFADIDQRLPNANEVSDIDEAADDRTLRKRTYIVEVYENESRGIVRRLANSLSIRRWTYKVSASAVYLNRLHVVVTLVSNRNTQCKMNLLALGLIMGSSSSTALLGH